MPVARPNSSHQQGVHGRMEGELRKDFFSKPLLQRAMDMMKRCTASSGGNQKFALGPRSEDQSPQPYTINSVQCRCVGWMECLVSALNREERGRRCLAHRDAVHYEEGKEESLREQFSEEILQCLPRCAKGKLPHQNKEHVRKSKLPDDDGCLGAT